MAREDFKAESFDNMEILRQIGTAIDKSPEEIWVVDNSAGTGQTYLDIEVRGAAGFAPYRLRLERMD